MAVLTNIPNNTSARDWRDTVNALIKRIAALEAAGVPVEVSAPAFTSQPSISPTSGTAGSTVYAATPGTVSNGSVVSRAWLLNGVAISNGVTAVPASSGTLTYQETASGPGGTTTSTVQVAAVTAAATAPTPAPSFSSQPSISPTSGTAGATTFTATSGTISNGSITSRSWTINGTVISTGLTASPASSGTLTYQETATGPGGTAQSTVQQVNVATAAAAAPAFTSQPTISPSTGTAGTTTYTATPGAVSNGTITSRSWSLNGSVISTGLTAAPASAGTLTYQEFATGTGGSASSSVLTRTVSAATPTLVLSPNALSIASNAAAGTLVSAISNVPTGVTPSVTPNDGRLVIAGDASAGWKVVVGMAALSAGTVNFSIAAAGATGASGVLTVTAAAGTSAFTMTQLASPNRIYQRSTTTNGGQSKGRGTIPVALDVSAAGSVYARARASDGTVLQASWLGATTTATGPQTVNIANVDARLGWFYLDLSADGTTWQNGTVLVGMGRITVISGQSQAVRQLGKMPSYSGTNASLGVSIEPKSAVYARYTDSARSVTTPAWAVPADASNYDSTFVAEFLRRQVADRGVNCAIVGHAVGATAIATWQPGQQNNTDLRAVLDAVGGFEAFYWHQGGDDAGAGTTAAAYQAGLSGVFGDLAAHNVARGNSFERYVTAMATRTSAGAGGTAAVQTVRKAAFDWSAANGATYLEPHDINLEDPVHQGQPGSITLARHLHRAMSAANDNGPTITGATRVATAITLATSAPLALVGNPANRFTVYAAGTTATPIAVSSVTISGSSINLTLEADPGSAQALDVYWLRHPDPSGTTAAANMIYDTYTADGLSVGRQLQPTLAAPISVPASGSGQVAGRTAKVNHNYVGNAVVAGYNNFTIPAEVTGTPSANQGLSAALQDDAGAATGWTMTVSQPFTGTSDTTVFGATTNNNSGVAPDAVLLSYWYVGDSSKSNARRSPAVLTLSGLNPAKLYDLSFVGSRGSTTARTTEYSAVGTNTKTGSHINNQNTTLSTALANMQPDANGNIVVTITPLGTGAFGYINETKIIEKAS